MKRINKCSKINTGFILLYNRTYRNHLIWISEAISPNTYRDLYFIGDNNATISCPSDVWRFDTLHGNILVFELTEEEVTEHIIKEYI